MSLASVRARLKDRQVKTGALGTIEATICLDVELIEELDRLEADLAMDTKVTETAEKPRAGGTRKSAEPKSDADLEAKVEAKRAEVQQSSLRLVFRSLSSTRYQEVINAHPTSDDDRAENAAFMNDLASRCLHQVWEQTADGEALVEGLSWAEIAEGCNYGEWEQATLKALGLNRRSVDIPFSLRSSKRTPE